MLGPGGAAVTAIEAAFPGVVAAGAVDRTQLAAKVFADPQALKRLEAIVHPLVICAQGRFLKAAARRGSPLAVLDIPLLFETGLDRLCDCIAVVSAPASVQYQRLIRRRTLDAVRIKATLARQMPDALKRRRADFIIPSGQGRALTRRVIVDIIRTLKDKGPADRAQTRWPRQTGRRSLTDGAGLR